MRPLTERITLRAKSDGTEISGELLIENPTAWYLSLATNTFSHTFSTEQWDRVYTLPTTPGTVFRATVRGVKNVRVMVSAITRWPYHTPIAARYTHRHYAEDIDASTVVIELEGDE